MKRFLIAALLLVPVTAHGQVVLDTPGGVVVAHDGIAELYDASGSRVWSATGLKGATRLVAGEKQLALLDAWNNRGRFLSLANGSGTEFTTGTTPVDALFAGDDLLVLERDAGKVSLIRADGSRSSLDVAADPAFIRRADDDVVYVYSRGAGVLQEIALREGALQLARKASVPRFAADMEVDGRAVYLLYPRAAVMITVERRELAQKTTEAGGSPSDLALIQRGNAVSAPRIAIADPTEKRVWITEGAQSVSAAFGRGFLRGLLGLGSSRSRSAEFPSAVDRVLSAGGITAVYDSVARTLHVLEGSEIRLITEDVGPQAFAITGGSIAIWRDGTLLFAD